MMIKMRNVAGVSLLAAGALALAGCGGSSDGEGLLTVKLTDSPVETADHVYVVFEGLEIKPVDDEAISFDFDSRREIDLLTLQDGVTESLLDGADVPVGDYEWIRLKIYAAEDTQDSSRIVVPDGAYANGQTYEAGTYPLFIPSGFQTGLKLVRPFSVAAGSTTRLVIDFDLRKSVIAPPGLAPNFLLKPTLRLVDELETGTVAGDVDVAYLADQFEVDVEACFPAVYLFEGGEATPDDADRDSADGADPVLYETLEPNAEGIAAYVFAFVAATRDGVDGDDYTVAFTCDGDVDAAPDESEYDPGAGEGEPGFETMAWVTEDFVVVDAGETTEVNFLPEAP